MISVGDDRLWLGSGEGISATGVEAVAPCEGSLGFERKAEALRNVAGGFVPKVAVAGEEGGGRGLC
ncbi:MAG: hypothetical protein ACJAQT_003976 [Akkermansiaceae bacterium]